jgi:hypothetical protein
MKIMNYTRNSLISLFVLFLSTSISCLSQDSIIIYDVRTDSISYKLMPAYSKGAISDSSNPSYGLHGISAMPANAPVNTYPNTNISLINNASYYYSNFNFPFTGVARIKYGISITTAVIGRRALLAFGYDVYDNINSHYWRSLHDINPCFENGSIQFGLSQLHPVRYYVINHPAYNYIYYFSVIEVAEDIGDEFGYFGLAFDTTLHTYDSLLLYNISYPNEGYPNHYPDSINGDTLTMKYGFISNPDDFIFKSSYGGDGEYVSPYFDSNFRIHGIRWSYTSNYKIGRHGFYFLKYVVDSLANGTRQIPDNTIFNIYPNPSSKIITINFPSPINEETTLEIFDILNRITLSSPIKKGELKTEIEISNLAKGLYFVRVIDKENIISGKFIKQ